MKRAATARPRGRCPAVSRTASIYRSRIDEIALRISAITWDASNGGTSTPLTPAWIASIRLPKLGHKRLDGIRLRDVEHLKADLIDRGLSAKTVNNVTGILGKLLRWAEEMEVIDKVPRIRKLKTQQPEFDFLEFDEAERLLWAAEYNPEWHAMILFALRSGLRYGELSELKWSDVDLVRGLVKVRRAVWREHVGPPKNGRNREIPLSEETIAYLKRHRHLRGEFVFCKADGSRHIHRRADAALKRCCRKAGLRNIGWHVLRHSFASHLVMRGVPLKAAQELMGHATIEMTMRYSHLSPNVRRDAVSVLDSTVTGHWQNLVKSSCEAK